MFFGEGAKPEKTLNWEGAKKDLVCFIYYISGDYNIVDDEVWVPYLNDNILWKGKGGMFGKKTILHLLGGKIKKYLKRKCWNYLKRVKWKNIKGIYN